MTLDAVVLILALASAQPEGLSTTAPPSDSARAEMAAGRHWRASLILRRAGAHRTDDPELRLLLAEAEAGWANWPEVARLLADGGAGGDHGGARRPLLLGRALEETGRWEGAAGAYGSALEAMGPSHAQRPVVLARLARSLVRSGRTGEARTALAGISGEAGVLRSWTAAEGAGVRAQAGDTAGVSALLGQVDDPAAARAAWRALPLARLAAGDTLGSQRAWAAAAAGGAGGQGAEASAEAGRLALALGDSAAARSLLLAGLDGGPAASRARAAHALLAFGDLEAATVLRAAEVLERAGDPGAAVRAYDRARRVAAAAGEALPPEARLARATLLAGRGGREDEALEEFRALRAMAIPPALAARNLEQWARLRGRQGRTGDVATLREWLLEAYPGSPEAVEVLWGRASQRDDAGDLDGALRLYARIVEAAPDHARAGEGLMRTGRILLGRGLLSEAAGTWEGYLADHPGGRRWEEASYWGARARLASGDTTAARRLVARLVRDEPFSYYSVLAAELLGQAFQVELAEGRTPASPAWMAEGLARLDLLAAAGLSAGADSEEARLTEQARGDADALLSLAEALVRRGRVISGINLGWELRRGGAPWDGRLARVVFPLPYRDLLVREARDQGLDPGLVAAVIRQESAFTADIVSHAGAVGLMQVMPATGRELARRLGPTPFSESHLRLPEVSLHLGSAFLRDMSRRFGGDLPLVLSAYNAGPSRAERWRRYPEAADPALFTERIPFDETRGYVKFVRRNLAVYRVLHGL